jgi:hypothetical protein
VVWAYLASISSAPKYMQVLLNWAKAEWVGCWDRDLAGTVDGTAADSVARCHVYYALHG